MLQLKDILLGLLLPLLLSGALAYALSTFRTSLGGALAIAAGFVTAYTLLFRWPGLRPTNDYEWLIPGALAAALIGTAAELTYFRLRYIWGLIIPAVAYLTVRIQLTGIELAALLAAGYLFWLLWDHLLSRSPGPWSGTVMTGVAGFTSLVLMLSDSQKFGQMGLALLGATAAIWLLGYLTKRDLYRGAALTWSLLLYSLLLNGKYWATPGLTWPNATLLLIAPLMSWIGEAPGVRHLNPWKRTALRIIAVLLPVLIATTLAAIEFRKAQQSGGADYY